MCAPSAMRAPCDGARRRAYAYVRAIQGEVRSHASAYVRAIQRRSARPCICICASGSVTKRTTAHLHMCKRFCDEARSRASAHVRALQGEAHSRASAYVRAMPRRSAQLRLCACASAQRPSAQPCTCACNHRRSAQPHICICASGAATNRIAVRLYLCKRPRNESHSHASACKWAINAAPAYVPAA